MGSRLLTAIVIVGLGVSALPAGAQPPTTPTSFEPAPPTPAGPGERRDLGRPPGSADPYLAFLPTDVEPDYAYWDALSAQEAQAPGPAGVPSGAFDVVHTEQEGGASGLNDEPQTAEAIGALAAGGDLTITGQLGPSPEVVVAVQDVGDSTGTAQDVSAALGVGEAVVLRDVSIGDGPHGTAGSGSGDFDFFRVSLPAGERLVVDVDTAAPFAGLDPIVAVYEDAAGGTRRLRTNDDRGVWTYDSTLVLDVPRTGTYWVAVGGRPLMPVPDLFPADPDTPGTGRGASSEGLYDVTISRVFDVDAFTVDLRAGDVLHVVGHDATGFVDTYLPNISRLVGGKGSQPGRIAPADSPFHGASGNTAVTTVVPEDGRYFVVTSSGLGAYTLEVSVRRPALEQRTGADRQILFLDFDGGTINPSIWGGPNATRVYSPLSAFMGRWGLVDEDSLIDRILGVFQRTLSEDLRAFGHTGDRDVSLLPGEFDVEIRNSRDHPDPAGQPNVTRLIVGGTIPEIGIHTLGIAQSIDVGNYDTTETAITLLDLLSEPGGPNSLNTFDAGGDKEGLVALGVGRITAHEAGHVLGSFHTENSNSTASVMDQGGSLANTLRLGPDNTFGTADDQDFHFESDSYAANEGFAGDERTDIHTAVALVTGLAAPTAPPVALANVGFVTGTDTVSATWTLPFDDGGDDVHTVHVQALDDSGAVTGSTSGGVRPPMVLTLPLGVHQMQVRGENHAGAGPWSPPVEVRLGRVPGAPTALGATPGVRSAVLSWTPPGDDGGVVIEEYAVTVSDPDGVVADVSTGGPEVTVSGLAEDVEHTFTVTAHNAIGTGPASGPSDAFVPLPPAPEPPVERPIGPQPANPPGEVPHDVVVSVDGDALIVSWSTVATRRAGTATSFRVDARDVNGEELAATVVEGPPASLLGIPAGSRLTVGVTPLNDAGAGQQTRSEPFTFIPQQPDGTTRIGDEGSPREQALAVCRHLVPGFVSADRVVLARDDTFADALAGAPLAGDRGCVLFTPGGPEAPLDPAVRAEIDRVLPDGGEIHLLGGTQAVSPLVAAELAAAGHDVTRFAGPSRFETAAIIAGEVHSRFGGGTALLASAADFPDALTGGAFAAAAGLPILLSGTEELHPAAEAALAEMGIRDTVLLGGTAVLTDAVHAAVPGPRRVAGADRMETAAAIAENLWSGRASDDTRVVVNTEHADAWMLALAAAPLAAVASAPLLGVGVDRLPEVTVAALNGIDRVLVIGGNEFVSAEVLTRLGG